MLYTVENTYDVGRPVDYVLDANGFRYDKDLISVDTETGVIKRRARDAEGNLVIDDDGITLVLETVQAVPPLIVLFTRGGKSV